MRRWISNAVVALVAMATAAVAEDSGLTRLDSVNQGRGWDAVGRLDVDGTGFCTGALIAPDIVLTAAHCLFDRETGARLGQTGISFLAGWRNGRASAIGTVRRAVAHPDYVPGADPANGRVSHDLALLQLHRPIRNGRIEPFATGRRPRKGDEVGVVSYARDRAEAPSLQEVCDVLSRQDGILVTSCAVDFGASGAPIFRVSDGTAEIVSVVSAKAEADGRPVALGTSLTRPLADLFDLLDAGAGFDIGSAPSARRISVGGDRAETGAKFIRP